MTLKHKNPASDRPELLIPDRRWFPQRSRMKAPAYELQMTQKEYRNERDMYKRTWEKSDMTVEALMRSSLIKQMYL